MRISKALVRKPGSNFADGVTEANLGAPDLQLALSQHSRYCQMLESCGLEVITLEADLNHPDCCFVEDAAIIVNDTAVVTRLGHNSRQGEEKAVGEALSRYKKIERISAPGTVDGGDVMRVGSHFFIGVSKRTNEDGAAQLAKIVKACGMTASMVPVEEFIHLKTAVSGVDDECIIGLKDLVSKEHFNRIAKKIIVPPEEHCAANCLSLNGTILVPQDSPKTVGMLESHGLKVMTVDTSEFQKMDGRLTCLSILF